MVFSDEDKILIKSFYLNVHTANRLTDELHEKRWTKLSRTLQDTGAVHMWPEI